MTLKEIVFHLMSNGAWWTPHQLAEVLATHYGRHVSGSSITARIRDQRKAGHTVEKAKLQNVTNGGNHYAYRLIPRVATQPAQRPSNWAPLPPMPRWWQ